MACVLIVDDDRTARALMAETLRKAGHETLIAGHGADARELYRSRGGVDVLIIDVCMPTKDDRETIRELRRAAPGVRIIAIAEGWTLRLGGPRQPDLLSDAKPMGADRVMRKPLNLGALSRAVAELAGDLRP